MDVYIDTDTVVVAIYSSVVIIDKLLQIFFVNWNKAEIN